MMKNVKDFEDLVKMEPNMKKREMYDLVGGMVLCSFFGYDMLLVSGLANGSRFPRVKIVRNR